MSYEPPTLRRPPLVQLLGYSDREFAAATDEEGRTRLSAIIRPDAEAEAVQLAAQVDSAIVALERTRNGLTASLDPTRLRRGPGVSPGSFALILTNGISLVENIDGVSIVFGEGFDSALKSRISQRIKSTRTDDESIDTLETGSLDRAVAILRDEGFEGGRAEGREWWLGAPRG